MEFMTIEEEVQRLITFLQHPAGFDVDMRGSLCIRPICEDCPPKHWEVDWEEVMDGVIVSRSKEFSDDLPGAALFFVEKRRYLCYGLDFEAIAWDQEMEKKNV